MVGMINNIIIKRIINCFLIELENEKEIVKRDYGHTQDIQITLESVCFGGPSIFLLYHMDYNIGGQ